MADVFISYHEASAGELAEQIADALESVGISCWYAKRDIPPGGDFVQRIPLEINRCKIFLLILNENMSKSRHIESEVGLAFRRWNHYEEITLLPLEIGDFKLKSWLDYYLIHAQSVKMPALDAERLGELARQVAKLLNREPTQQKVEPQPPTPPAKIIKRGECGDSVTFALDENGVLIISGVGAMRDFDCFSIPVGYNGRLPVTTPWRNERKDIFHIVIEYGVTTIGEWAFAGCGELEDVYISNSVTKIGGCAFDGCAGLISVFIPDSVTEIGGGAFYDCTELRSVFIPDSVTEIGRNAFDGCMSLTSVSVPAKAKIDDTVVHPFHVHIERRT